MDRKLYTERILIIEDEDLIRMSLRSRLSKEGYEVDEAADGETGLRKIAEMPPDLVLLDYKLPGRDGMSVLREIAEVAPSIVVILMTAHGTVESVVEAMKLGAYTYLNKPFDMDEMVAHIEKGLETTALRREVDRLRREAGEGAAEGAVIVAESPRMREILETVKKVNAVGAATLVLRGENGTGKDVLSRVIHATSVRADQPFLNITCTALPDALLESELFGHEKGAFTDARSRKKGLFELADGGTVFLDEIGDMSLPLQGKLLRFLEEKAFRRVGGTEDIKVDVRIVAATNRDLEQLVEEGIFRQDLFYRISVIPITVPPLRERLEDIVPLTNMFISRYCNEFKREVSGVTDDVRECLEAHTWPGNVRELRNVIERAMILGSSGSIGVDDMPPEIRAHSSNVNKTEGALRGWLLPDGGIDFEELEKHLVIQALERSKNNQTRAARLLGMTRDQIRYRIEKFKLTLRSSTGK